MDSLRLDFPNIKYDIIVFYASSGVIYTGIKEETVLLSSCYTPINIIFEMKLWEGNVFTGICLSVILSIGVEGGK